MHFGLTEEQNLLQESLRNFASREAAPGQVRAIFDGDAGWDADLWRRAAEVGVQGLSVPEAYGGSGLEFLDLALAFEVLGEFAVPGPFLGHALASLAIARHGSAAQRERWLPRLASGESPAACALAESNSRWTPEAWELTPDAGRISGSKYFVEALPETQVAVVALAGGRLALVELSDAGVTREDVDRLDRGRPLAHLHFQNAAIEALGDADTGAAELVTAGCILLAADAFGAAWKLVRLTTEYALAREQFGTPIAQFQAVKHQIANMAKEAEPMRGLVWYAAYAFDHRPAECARDAALAKAHITEQAMQIGRDAVSLHGGIGFTWECDVQFWVKRTMHDRSWLGLPESHRERAAELGGW